MRKDIQLVVGDKTKTLRVKFDVDDMDDLKEKHGAAAIETLLAEAVCRELNREITPELIQSMVFDA